MTRIINLNGNDWILTGWMENQWRAQKSAELEASINPAIRQVKALVPGSVHNDLLREGIIKDPFEGLESLCCEWINNREWIYNKKFRIKGYSKTSKYYLCCEGLDFHGEIYIDNKFISKFSGMSVPHRIEISSCFDGNREYDLSIVFHLTPNVNGQYGFTQQIEIIKSRFNYGWDWCPRIVPVGIWDDIYIKETGCCEILDFYPEATLNASLSSGEINSNININSSNGSDCIITYNVSDELGIKQEFIFKEKVFEGENRFAHKLQIENIKLWWPNNSGKSSLYSIEMNIHNEDFDLIDFSKKNVGFRKIEFVRCREDIDILPYNLILNNKRIFLKGTNWVPITPFYGNTNREMYKNILLRLREMNCNILRVWGGAILEKKDFYELCDEYGIMVWQEFPQSSSGLDNLPSTDLKYFEELSRVCTSYLERRRHHVSNIIWCGGNELLDESWIPVDFTNDNIALLNDLTKKFDPQKLFLPCSPSGPSFVANSNNMGQNKHHDVHGPWNYLGPFEHYSFFNSDDSILRSETGCPGIARMSLLEKYKGNYDIWPPDETNPYWNHRGSWWIQTRQLEELFGYWDEDGNEIETYVQASRFVQSEALRYAIYSTRRREPMSSGFLIWMGNEPYPNNANTSVLEYDGIPKPSYYWIKDAFMPFQISLEYERLNYEIGDIFNAKVWVHDSEGICNQSELHLDILISDINGKILYESKRDVQNCYPNKIIEDISWKIPIFDESVFFVRLSFDKGSDAKRIQTYLFAVNDKDNNAPLNPFRKLPRCKLNLRKVNNEKHNWVLENKSDYVAALIFLSHVNDDNRVCFSDNYFTLMPNEDINLKIISISGSKIKRGDIVISSYNFKPFKLEE